MKHMSKYIVLGFLILSLPFLTKCGGGGGGGGSGANDTFNITGTVSVPAGQLNKISAEAFTNTAFAGAHVNVCTIQNGMLAPLPAHPTVLADASGSFDISVNKNDVPSNKQMWVCASPPTSDNFTVLSPIPEDLFPEDLTDVSTISVNPNTNTTIITRYACSTPIMLFNSNKCLATNQNQLQVLNNALDAYASENPSATVDLGNLSTPLSDIANDSSMKLVLVPWLAEVPDVSYANFILGAQVLFTNPTIPSPSGDDGSGDDASASISGLICVKSLAEPTLAFPEPRTLLTVNASGSAGGGDEVQLVSILFNYDTLGQQEPSTLDCGSWEQDEQSTCEPLQSSGNIANFTATSLLTVSPGPLEPSSVTVEVAVIGAGIIPLAFTEQTVTCG